MVVIVIVMLTLRDARLKVERNGMSLKMIPKR